MSKYCEPITDLEFMRRINLVTDAVVLVNKYKHTNFRYKDAEEEQVADRMFMRVHFISYFSDGSVKEWSTLVSYLAFTEAVFNPIDTNAHIDGQPFNDKKVTLRVAYWLYRDYKAFGRKD